MAKILPDREIKSLIGTVLLDADERCINPNGIELRLGEDVHFYSTGEKRKLSPGLFLKVNPGETVIISSLEKLDFGADTVKTIYPEQMLTAFITPTTTMMREGISQVSTKVDAGFRGNLNWAFRNSSAKEFIIQYGEPLFKVTFFLLDKGESPDVPYGEGETHRYQDTEGVRLSARQIPVHIPKNTIIGSSFDKLDPKQQLREAGHPFDHIGTELTQLQGKWEVVSSDVRLLKEQFEKQAKDLSAKIDGETEVISTRMDEWRDSILEKVESLFDRKFMRIVGVLIGAISIMGGICKFLYDKKVGAGVIVTIAIGAGVIILLVTCIVTKHGK